MIRGVKHITIILSTIFALITNTSCAQESFTINYTAPIGMQIFNPNKTNNKNIGIIASRPSQNLSQSRSSSKTTPFLFILVYAAEHANGNSAAIK